MTRVQAFPYRSNAAWMLASSPKAFHTRAGRALYWQWSPRNSRLPRLFFQRWVLQLMRLLRINTFSLDLPAVSGVEWVGIAKVGKTIVFELEGDRAVAVWKRSTGDWQRESMLGYPVVEAYTPEALYAALPVISEALQSHAAALISRSASVHGDFTHFNTLIDERGKLHFIDAKPGESNLLYDFFYFKSYLADALTRCTTLDAAVRNGFLSEVDGCVRDAFGQLGAETVLRELETLKTPAHSGLHAAQGALLSFKTWTMETLEAYSATNGGTSSGAVR